MMPTVRQQRLAALRGQTLAIPHTRKIFPDWPVDRHPEYLRLNQVINHDLNRSDLGYKKGAQYKEANFGLFGCTWWPEAEYTVLETVTRLTAWVFYALVDAIPVSTDSSINEVQAGAQYYKQTRDFSAQCLGLRDHLLNGVDLHPRIAILEELLFPFVEADVPLEFRQRLQAEIEAYSKTEIDLYRSEIAGEPCYDVDGYLISRVKRSGLTVCLVLNEYVNSDRYWFPQHIVNCGGMREIWRQYNMIISICTDIVSCKRELDANSLVNYIPISCRTQSKSVDQAAKQATDDIISAVGRFDQASRNLLASLEQERDEQENQEGYDELIGAVRSYIQICRSNCTGFQEWSFYTKWYGLRGVKVDDDGFARVTL